MLFTFTENDIRILSYSWRNINRTSSNLGVEILIRLFEMYPHNMDKFNRFKGLPLSSLKASPAFKALGDSVLGVFSKSLEILETSTDLRNFFILWEREATNHYRKNIPPESFVDFKCALMDILKNKYNILEIEQKAWDVFFDNIFNIIFEKIDQLKLQSC